jgi:thiol:disulfide interchange protein
MGEVSRLTPGLWSRSAVALCWLIALQTEVSRAQDNPFGGPLSLDGFGDASEPTITVSLAPADAKPGDDVRLSLRLLLPPGSHTYSQDPTFEKPTEIVLSEIVGLDTLEDQFAPDHPPKRAYDREFKKQVDKFTDEVTWTRRFRLRPDVPADGVYVRGRIDFLVCDANSCDPYDKSFAVSLTGAPVPPPRPVAPRGSSSASPDQPVEYEQRVQPTRRLGGVEEPDPLRLHFQLAPESAAVGAEVTLTITMDIDDGWHGFSQQAGPRQISKETLIRIGPLQNLELLGDFREEPEPKLVDGTELTQEGRVKWSRVMKVTGAGGYGLAGSIRYQVCKEGQCLTPETVPFALGVLPPASRSVAADGALTETNDASSGGTIAISSFTLREVEPPSSLAMNLLFAFIGGMILNVMPCVLPVIAIKVLSFVQQAGESRGQILLLNVAYSLGVVLVFVVLATLAVFLGFSWGGLFQLDEFNLVMAAVVFAMGLSLLGVFEIPVPGMVGAGAGGQHREGLTGAFLTGIFATLLATPCTGPFMGTTLAWSVKQPSHVVYLVWGTMGLGMAFPYLVLGAFPALVRWLPRPGMWMVRLKEFAGFVLMGAVIFLIQSINQSLLIPTLVILVGVALGLWMIGNLYDHSTSLRTKWTVRLTALALSSFVCLFGWNLQYSGEGLPWEKFSTAKVEELRKSGKPILIDFTADWCTNCKVNERLALNRRETIAFVEKHGIVTLKADFTDKDPEIKEWLALCKERGVPLTLIFPRNRPNEAIPVRGVFTQATLLAKLEQAVANEGAESVPQVASDGRTSAAPRLPASEGAAVTR